MHAIGLDLTCLEAPVETGVERYARRLAETLPRVVDDLIVTIIVRAGKPAPRVQEPARVIAAGGGFGRSLWREITLPQIVAREGVELLHAPVAAVATLTPARKVVTIHDVPGRHGIEGEGGILSRHRLRLMHALAVADAIITPSEATRDAILAVASVPADRIAVIPHGVDPDFRPIGPSLARERYGIPPGPYLLTVGTLRARKDPATAISALARLVKDAERDLRLVFAGRQDMDPTELRTMAHRLGVLDRVVFAGYVAREDLPDLYREAEAFVLPSLLEGFGMPLVEAMASGTPVVASDAASIPEVVGDGALLFPAGNDDALARRLADVLDQPEYRAQLVARGRARAEQFTWEGCARRHADVYRAVLGGAR